MLTRKSTWSLVSVAAALGVLGFYQSGSAQTKKTPPPFANSVEQQGEMIQLLRDIREELKKQNTLLSSGRLTVVVQGDPKK